MTRRRVITERDIRRASSAGDTSVEVGDAVVTPSARDAAVRAKITLVDPKRPPEPARRTPAPRPGKTPTRAEAAKTPPQRTNPPAPSRQQRSSSDPARVEPTATATSPRTPPAAERSTKNITVAVGADHGGVSMKTVIADRLRELGYGVLDFGSVTKEPVDYPDFAIAVGKAVADGRAQMGVMIDGAGIGSCMAANKVRGVRAAMCYDVTTAANAREHNNANVLTLGAGLIGSRLATAILETFLSTSFGGGRHKTRVDKIDALDRPG